MKRDDDALRSALLLGMLGVGVVWAVRSGVFDAVLERILGVHGAPREHVAVEADLASHTLSMERGATPGVPLM